MNDAVVGLFGGTFDPPHRGHSEVLRAAVRSGRYRHVVVTVTAQTAEKADRRGGATGEQRVAMVRAAWGDWPGVVIDDREVRRGGTTYTIDTVRDLLAEGESPLELIVGADVANSFDRWARADELSSLVSVAVVPRAGTPVSLPAPWRWHVLDMPEIDLSSTQLRGATDAEALAMLDDQVIPLYLALQD